MNLSCPGVFKAGSGRKAQVVEANLASQPLTLKDTHTMKRAVTTALVLSLLGGSAALAQPAPYGRQDDRGGRYDERVDRRDDRRDDRADRAEDRRQDARDDHRDERRAYRMGQRDGRGRYYAGEYNRPMGWQDRSWRRGERLPSSYRSQNYYVSNYGAYGLRAPPRGYRYVRVNNDIVMVAIVSGLISQILSDRLFY